MTFKPFITAMLFFPPLFAHGVELATLPQPQALMDSGNVVSVKVSTAGVLAQSEHNVNTVSKAKTPALEVLIKDDAKHSENTTNDGGNGIGIYIILLLVYGTALSVTGCFSRNDEKP